MRILEINAYYSYGSTGRIVKDLCEEGEKRGHEMYAVYWLLRGRETETVVFCGEDREPSKIAKILQWIFDGGKLSYHAERTRRIIREINRIKPDVIHLHNLHGDFEYGSIDVEMFFAALSEYGCRVIWTFHDCWPVTGRCYYFSYKQCGRWKTGCGGCLQRWFDREGIIRDCSGENWKRKNVLYKGVKELTVVTVSEWLNSVVGESMLKGRRIVTIYNGVDTDAFRPEGPAAERDRFTILCIGWDRRKGYKDYFKLAKVLREDEEIVVVGKRPFFRRHHRLPENMREIGRATSKEKMAEIYRSAQVYFNASPAETFGLTTAEAMSCGTPVIGYRNTATVELLEQAGGINKLVRNGSIDEVRAAIDSIRREKADKEMLHKRCGELFKHSLMMDRYMGLYAR